MVEVDFMLGIFFVVGAGIAFYFFQRSGEEKSFFTPEQNVNELSSKATPFSDSSGKSSKAREKLKGQRDHALKHQQRESLLLELGLPPRILSKEFEKLKQVVKQHRHRHHWEKLSQKEQRVFEKLERRLLSQDKGRDNLLHHSSQHFPEITSEETQHVLSALRKIAGKKQ